MQNRNHHAWRELVSDIKPNLAITLGAGLSVSADILNRDARHFFNRIQREAWGPRWHHNKKRHLIRAVGFHEHPDSNRHIHIALRAPYVIRERLMLVGERLWKETRKGAHYYAQPIDDVTRYVSYITKDAWSEEAQHTSFVYASRKR